MANKYMLQGSEYTIYNAISWGNCLNHWSRAKNNSSNCYQRIFHAAVAALEFIPLISQVISFLELSAARLFLPSMTDLAKKNIKIITPKKEDLENLERKLDQQSEVTAESKIIIPTKSEDKKIQGQNCNKLSNFLRRTVEKQYRDLPLPQDLKKVFIFNKAGPGNGDIAASAKVISILYEKFPQLNFKWLIQNYSEKGHINPKAFIPNLDQTRVNIQKNVLFTKDDLDSLDFVVYGPVVSMMMLHDIPKPFFNFWEIASDEYYNPFITDESHDYSEFHKNMTIFSTEHNMGLKDSSGVLIDKERINAPLSRGYCCPSYLKKIEDVALRKDILEAMNVFDNSSEPDYDQFSFNSGYAHYIKNRKKFIRCVATHEKEKNVVIVLNQYGFSAVLSMQEMKNQIFDSDFLDFMNEKGFGDIILKGSESLPTVIKSSENSNPKRSLTLIVRPSFSPKDMKHMQLASERLLATGDNSAIEAWSSRCKLFLYEDVGMQGCKWRFLQQQVDLAKTISLNLSELLALFGRDRRNPEMTEAQISARMEELLKDPKLSDSTLEFCDKICSSYSFESIVLDAFKRAAWLHKIPELESIEIENMDQNFKEEINSYFKEKEFKEKVITIKNLPLMQQKIAERINRYIADQAN